MLHAARIAGECGAQKFVLISTDMAANPTNIMDATKRMADPAPKLRVAKTSGQQAVAIDGVIE